MLPAGIATSSGNTSCSGASNSGEFPRSGSSICNETCFVNRSHRLHRPDSKGDAGVRRGVHVRAIPRGLHRRPCQLRRLASGQARLVRRGGDLPPGKARLQTGILAGAPPPSGQYYDRNIPGEGLLIWHVRHPPAAERASSPLVDVECADGRWLDAGYPLAGSRIRWPAWRHR